MRCHDGAEAVVLEDGLDAARGVEGDILLAEVLVGRFAAVLATVSGVDDDRGEAAGAEAGRFATGEDEGGQEAESTERRKVEAVHGRRASDSLRVPPRPVNPVGRLIDPRSLVRATGHAEKWLPEVRYPVTPCLVTAATRANGLRFVLPTRVELVVYGLEDRVFT